MEILYLSSGDGVHGFSVYPVGTVFSSIGGVYALLDGEGVVLYVGITSSFQRRFYQHPTYVVALGLGMTHVGVLKVRSGRKRRKIEKGLVGALKPRLNRYLV